MESSLPATQRRMLRAQAHRLSPAVTIGAAGLTPAVLAEIDRTLCAHELIKIKLFVEARAERTRLLNEICSAQGAIAVQHIGKTIVVYRQLRLSPQAKAKPPKARFQRKPPRRTKRSFQA